MPSVRPPANRPDAIFEDLRARILSGRLAPGERLPPERELSVACRATRNTLREAVSRLEQERLVSVRHGQGVTVADFRRTATVALLGPFLEHGGDAREKARVLLDVLPARTLVVEFAAGLASRRASSDDLDRLAEAGDAAIGDFERRDRAALVRAFHRWLDALVDAAHSVPIRWIANPFLEAERDVMRRFPALWIFDPVFPRFVRRFDRALRAGDGKRARAFVRDYFGRIDRNLAGVLEQALGGQPRDGDPAAGERRGRAR